MERFKFGQRPRLKGRLFRRLIWGNIILSLLNKVCINSSAIGRHGGGVIDNRILQRYTRCFDSGVRARAIHSEGLNVIRDKLNLNSPN